MKRLRLKKELLEPLWPAYVIRLKEEFLKQGFEVRNFDISDAITKKVI